LYRDARSTKYKIVQFFNLPSYDVHLALLSAVPIFSYHSEGSDKKSTFMKSDLS